jgi:hypothetical protein
METGIAYRLLLAVSGILEPGKVGFGDFCTKMHGDEEERRARCWVK